MDQVKVYGRDWCDDTQATLNHLDSLGVQFQYIDIEKDQGAADWVREQNGGKHRTPTLDIAGQILVEPDERDLTQAVRSKWLMG
jgi:mycoredoxin